MKILFEKRRSRLSSAIFNGDIYYVLLVIPSIQKLKEYSLSSKASEKSLIERMTTSAENYSKEIDLENQRY